MNGRPDIVVITGASAGVGRATVREFAKRGAWIGLIARGKDGLEAAKRDVEEAGGRALAIVADVANDRQIEDAAEQVERDLGPIDIWINNAMTSVFSPISKMKPEEFRRVTDVTYLGTVFGTMAALRRMIRRGRGTIVQVGSALAYRSIPLQSAYCAAKHAVKGFTDSLRCELIHDGNNVQLTMVQLPALNTPQFGWVKSRLFRRAQPVPPIFQPEVAARAIYWASYHPRREVFVGGPTVRAIVGQKLVPGVLDFYLGKTGYDSQQYDGLRNADALDNLFEPLPGDAGAHGAFDERARSSSIQLWLTMNRRWLMLAGVGIAGGIYAALAARSNGQTIPELIE
jgi:NAD(P)-dependent dehydrogenase (short-subunit alcohol dehydrogenase family)